MQNYHHLQPTCTVYCELQRRLREGETRKMAVLNEGEEVLWLCPILLTKNYQTGHVRFIHMYSNMYCVLRTSEETEGGRERERDSPEQENGCLG